MKRMQYPSTLTEAVDHVRKAVMLGPVINSRERDICCAWGTPPAFFEKQRVKLSCCDIDIRGVEKVKIWESRALRLRQFIAYGWLAGLLGVAGQAGAATLQKPAISGDGRWIADQGNGTYRNPVLIGDYSDPDVVRVGEDYYLTASSFTDVPGLPILHSRDLVNWTIIGHALPRLEPEAHYAVPRRGGGVWAPTFRYHNGRFVIYYCDPDRGVFMVWSNDPAGAWSTPVQVDPTVGMIDPAPFWDEDGKGWLAYAYARSRAGRANVIGLKRLNEDGSASVGDERVVIDGDMLPQVATSVGLRPWQTTEGPKIYKRDGWYYILVPSGSVKGGWQGAFRSRAITGPYEGRNVMDQGHSRTNGPHQGAWVTTPSGEDWFLHFQDRDSYGRVVHLQPMKWKNGWPVIGNDPDGDGRGEPVSTTRKPALPAQPLAAPQASDEFDGPLSPAWQFGSNPGDDWMSLKDGLLRLKSVTGSPDLYETGAILSQKLPAEAFTLTTLMKFAPLRVGERAGLAVHGTTFSWIGIEQSPQGPRIVQAIKADAKPGSAIRMIQGDALGGDRIWLRLNAHPVEIDVPPPDFSPYWPSMLRETHLEITFAYSLDGKLFRSFGESFQSRPGRWVGTQVGLFAQAMSGAPAATATTVGHADFEWFRASAQSDPIKPERQRP